MQPPKFLNRRPPEGISSGHEHPLAEAAKSVAAVVAGFVVLLVLAYVALRAAVPYIPFSWEKTLAEATTDWGTAAEEGDPATGAYLRALGQRLSAAMDLPPEMTVTVHYVKGDTVNAFATLGGHIFVYEGLWRLLTSENAAAMLLAHEIAHVRNRDPLRGAGTTLLVALAATVFVGDGGLVGDLVGAGQQITALHFSREQESEADADAIEAVVALYGHIDGALDLFAALQAESKDRRHLPAFLSSHPGLEARIDQLAERARRNGWRQQGEKTPLPRLLD